MMMRYLGSRISTKLRSSSGLSWITLLMMIVVLGLTISALLPVIKQYREEGNAVACATGLDTARRQLATGYMVDGYNSGTAKDAQDLVSQAMNGWDDLCPDNGTCYIVPNTKSEMEWDVVCGLHGADKKYCTRLNADYVKEQLEAALKKAQLAGDQYPESLPYTLHGKERTAYLVDQPTGLKWGTRLSSTYDGIVAFYSIVGHSTYGNDSGKKEGELWYFSYADEEHCANWSYRDSWTGDSYRGLDE